MDIKFFDNVFDEIPKFNEDICNGLVCKEIKHAMSHIDKLLNSVQDSLPESLRYIGLERASPLEDYLNITEPRSTNKPMFEIARSDVFLVNINFEFEGELIQNPIYLPYARDGGIISIRGSGYHVSPVMSDKGVSINSKSVFIGIPKSKMTFKKTLHHILANGVRKTPIVAYAWLHNRKRNSPNDVGKPTIVANTTLPHYLFCKYGLKETFKRFANTSIIVGENLTTDDYPSDKWVIYKSIGIKPRGVKKLPYVKSDICIAVRSCDQNIRVESLVSGFYYVVDHFPDRFKSNYFDGTEDEIGLWRVILGHIIGGVTGGEGTIRHGMNQHMASLDAYIDSVAKLNLAQGDIHVDDIYQLLWLVISMLNSNIARSSYSNPSSIYEKQIVVLNYLLQDISDGINRMLFSIKNRESKKPLTFVDVQKIIRGTIKRDAIMDITKHSEVNVANSSGDNKIHLTTTVALQTNSGSSKKREKVVIDDTSYLHTSLAEVGSYLVLPKTEPTGRNKLNPWVKIDAKGFIIKDPNKKELLERTERVIER